MTRNPYFTPLVITIVLVLMVLYWYKRVRIDESFATADSKGTAVFPASYVKRIKQLCKLGYANTGYNSYDTCMMNNAPLLHNEPIKKVYSRLIMDDAIYGCMLDRLRAGQDMNECIRSFLYTKPELAKALVEAMVRISGKSTTNNITEKPSLYDERVRTLCAGKSSCLSTPQIESTSTWRDIIADDSKYQKLKAMMSNDQISIDVALIRLMNSYPQMATSMIDQAFPETRTTRSTRLTPKEKEASYEARVAIICDIGYKAISATFANTESCNKSEIVQAMLHDTMFRSVFQKILMNDEFWGCLDNNLKIDGDIYYCFYTYFMKHPNEYEALINAAARLNLAKTRPRSTTSSQRTDKIAQLATMFELAGCDILQQHWRMNKETILRTRGDRSLDDVGTIDLIVHTLSGIGGSSRDHKECHERVKDIFAEQRQQKLNTDPMFIGDHIIASICKTEPGYIASNQLPSAARKSFPQTQSVISPKVLSSVKSLRNILQQRGCEALSKIWQDIRRHPATRDEPCGASFIRLKASIIRYVAMEIPEIYPQFEKDIDRDLDKVLAEIKVDACSGDKIDDARIKQTFEALLQAICSEEQTASHGNVEEEMQVLDLTRLADGRYELHWRYADSKIAGHPMTFDDLKSFQNWWATRAGKAASMNRCTNPMSAVPTPTCKRHDVSPACRKTKTTQEAALTCPRTSETCDANRENLEMRYMTIMSEMRNMRESLERKSRMKEKKDREEIKHLKHQLKRHKETSAKLLKRLDQCNFVYMPPDQWPRRSPVCLGETPSTVLPVVEDYPKETMMNV